MAGEYSSKFPFESTINSIIRKDYQGGVLNDGKSDGYLDDKSQSVAGKKAHQSRIMAARTWTAQSFRETAPVYQSPAVGRRTRAFLQMANP